MRNSKSYLGSFECVLPCRGNIVAVPMAIGSGDTARRAIGHVASMAVAGRSKLIGGAAPAPARGANGAKANAVTLWRRLARSMAARIGQKNPRVSLASLQAEGAGSAAAAAAAEFHGQRAS